MTVSVSFLSTPRGYGTQPRRFFKRHPVARRAIRCYPTLMSENQQPLQLREFQALIRQKYYETDAARGTPGTYMWFIEEVGELATALQKRAGEGGATSGDPAPEGEFADVLAWLCTLANINEIDLEAAVRRKYLGDDQPSGHK